MSNLHVWYCFRNGEEWHKHRRPISKFMSVPRKVAEYHQPFNEVTTDLIEGIRRSRDNRDMLSDTTALLQKWAFESMYNIGGVHLLSMKNK